MTKVTVPAKTPATKKSTTKAKIVKPAEKSATKKTAATKAKIATKAEVVTSIAKRATKTKTTVKKGAKTVTAATKKSTKSVAAEQLTLVDALPVAAEPPAAAAPAPEKAEVTKVASSPEEAEPKQVAPALAPTPALQALEPAPVEAPATTPVPQTPMPAAVEESSRRAEDMGPERVRAALHWEHNSRGRGRSEAEKRESYARYRANKKLAMQLETRNTRYLILFPASDADTNAEKFYNMAGNSAIIYCHEIGPRLKRKPVLRRDMDLGPDRSQSGICSISNLAALEQRLAEIGVKRRDNHGDLVIFKLAREYPKDEIREMLKQEQVRLDALNKLIYSEVLFPDIHRQIIELKRLVPAKVKNMDKTYRDVIGIRIMEPLMEVVRNYSEMTHGDTEVKVAAEKMMRELDMMLAEVSMLNELKLWEVSTCTRVASAAVMIRQLIRGKILNK